MNTLEFKLNNLRMAYRFEIITFSQFIELGMELIRTINNMEDI